MVEGLLVGGEGALVGALVGLFVGPFVGAGLAFYVGATDGTTVISTGQFPHVLGQASLTSLPLFNSSSLQNLVILFSLFDSHSQVAAWVAIYSYEFILVIIFAAFTTSNGTVSINHHGNRA